MTDERRQLVFLQPALVGDLLVLEEYKHMEYFHLDYRSVDFFIGRLQTRLRQSTSAVLRGRFARWDVNVHGEPALAVVAKIEMLNRVLARLNADVAKLVQRLASVPDAVEQYIRERRAISVPDQDLLWYLSVDVEAFLFEARSAYEILGGFLKEFFQLIFQRKSHGARGYRSHKGPGRRRGVDSAP